jgi:hypothetical protein
MDWWQSVWSDSAMKALTVHLADEIYARAEQKAAQRGATLSAEVTEFIRRYSDGAEVGNGAPASSGGGVERLFAALDGARNIAPVGRLRRDDLYDRRILY